MLAFWVVKQFKFGGTWCTQCVPRHGVCGLVLHTWCYVTILNLLGGGLLGKRLSDVVLLSLSPNQFESDIVPKVRSEDNENDKDDDEEVASASVSQLFLLGEDLPVVPERLVKWILKPVFADMAELLKDNMEVERQRSLLEGSSASAFHWLQSFSLYAAVICSRYPKKNRELFAYQSFIVGEARCGGRGLLMYNVAFQQQMTSIESTNFEVLNQSLFSTTCLAYG